MSDQPNQTAPTPAPAPARLSARAAQPAPADPKPTPRKVEPLTDVEIAQLAQQGRLHATMEQNTRARDAALARMAAQAEVDAEAEAKAVEEARNKTNTLPGP